MKILSDARAKYFFINAIIGYLVTIVLMAVAFNYYKISSMGLSKELLQEFFKQLFHFFAVSVVPLVLMSEVIYRWLQNKLKNPINYKRILWSVLAACLVALLTAYFTGVITHTYEGIMKGFVRDSKPLSIVLISFVYSYVGFIYSIPAVLIFGSWLGCSSHQRA